MPMPETPSISRLIEHVFEFPAYSPPMHHGAVNRRLVDRDLGAEFEMILGRLEPGGDHTPEGIFLYALPVGSNGFFEVAR